LDLFRCGELIEVATENLMQVSQGLLLHSDRDAVRRAIKGAFGDVSDQLVAQAPETARELSSITIGEADKNAMLTWMRLMSVPEVRSVGFDVALAIRASGSLQREVVLKSIEKLLRPHLGGIERLRDEVISGPLFDLWGTGHQWEMTLDRENVQVMEASNSGGAGQLYAGAASQIPRLEEKNRVVLGGALEEARALLDGIRLLARHAGTAELVIPVFVTSLGAHLDLGPQALSCELDLDRGGEARFIDFAQALFCPLKYGTQGMDALRAVSDMMSPPKEGYMGGEVAGGSAVGPRLGGHGPIMGGGASLGGGSSSGSLAMAHPSMQV